MTGKAGEEGLFSLTAPPRLRYTGGKIMDTLVNILNGISALLKAGDLMPDFTTPRGIFCAIAWVATLLALGLFVISLFADADTDGDVGSDADVGNGDTGFFSVRALIGFLLGFGWGGFVSIQTNPSVLVAVLVGFGVGAVMFVIVAGMMKLIYSLKSDGTLKHDSLVGLTGTVYVTVPPHGEPGGQVQIAHPSQLLTIAAVQEGDTPLPAQTRVEVVKATTYLVTVRPL